MLLFCASSKSRETNKAITDLMQEHACDVNEGNIIDRDGHVRYNSKGESWVVLLVSVTVWYRMEMGIKLVYKFCLFYSQVWFATGMQHKLLYRYMVIDNKREKGKCKWFKSIVLYWELKMGRDGNGIK